MERCMTRSLGWLTCLGLLVVSSAQANDAPAFSDSSLDFFEKQVRPLLAAKCSECHAGGDREPKGGLRLDSREAVLKGGDTGPAVELDKPAKSLFLSAINYGDVYQMPPKSKMSADEIAVLTKWVELGLPWPKEAAISTGTVKPFDLNQRRSEHWCWQSIHDVAPPDVKVADWPLSAADRFILAQLEQKGLKPAPQADKRTLLRRVHFDLVGLPPSPAEVIAFEQDQDPRALERVVDRLLSSVHFGERWARHWLDLVRYAETRGHEFDPQIPNSWQYRDYVIRALNADVPYDQFLTEHLAGDLVEPRWRIDEQLQPVIPPINEAVLGTGFWFLGEEVHSPVDIRKDETDRMDNRLDVMTKTFLGLTVACARCHDHKFDAISQRDYYALAGYAISGGYRQVRVDTAEQHRQIAVQLDEIRAKARRDAAQQILKTTSSVVDALDRYWLAAKRVLDESPSVAAADVESAPSIVSAVERQAAEESLDARLLGRWCVELKRAASDAKHPLHRLFDVASSTGVQKQSATTVMVDPSTVVVDFGDPASTPVIQDGVSFGLRPVARGQLMLGGTAETPSVRITTIGGWERDMFWKNNSLVHGTEVDHSGMGGWQPYGRMVRSPEFTLKSHKLWYLVRGSVRVYAVVNSHLTIAGPLHGSLLHEYRHNDDQWHWIPQGLDQYQGHRLHVEISPVDDSACAVAMIVQTDEQPQLPETNWVWLNEAVPVGATLTDRMTAFQNIFRKEAVGLIRTQLADLSGPSKVVSTSHSAQANLANWFVTHLKLFTVDDTDSRIAVPFEAEAALAQQVKWASTLAPAMLEGNGVDEFLLVRGNSNTPKDLVARRFLEALGGHADNGRSKANRVGASGKELEPTAMLSDSAAGTAAAPKGSPSSYFSGSGRLELAREILRSPLASRVAVNRIWHHLFGRGIVSSVDNFGVLGLPPSHPELLDHLAIEFEKQGWSTKAMIKSLILSRTYQMSSHPTDADEEDPNNTLWHRMPIKRLEGEVIRDSLLTVSGRLNPKAFGPSVPIHLTEFMQGRGRPGASGPLDGDGRRSIYIAVRRNFLSPMMLAFDTPSPFSTVGRRTNSNVPAQALILMNDPFVISQARLWADRLLAESSLTTDQRIEQVYLTAFGRTPTADERAEANGFLHQFGEDSPDGRKEAWSNLCHVMFNVKEFVFVE